MSRSVNVYDKEIERTAKGKEIRSHEKNIIRYEAQIRNSHINYRYAKHNTFKDFRSYFNMESYCSYMKKMILKIIGTGNYYSLDQARKKIKVSNLKEKDKEQLVEFLKMVSISKMTKTRERVGRDAFEKCINNLKKLEINPVVIPKHYDLKFISNPLTHLEKMIKDYYSNIKIL